MGEEIREKTYARGLRVTGNHDDGANRAVFRDETGSRTTIHIVKVAPIDMLAHTYLVVRTRIAPAFCSRLALTAAMAQLSAVGTGVGTSFLSSSKALT